MAVFASDKKDGAKEAPQRPAQRGEPALTIVAQGTRVEGELRSNGVVKVEGIVVGTVHAERQVLVSRGGLIEGDVLTREAVLGGEVKGGVVAEERVEVQTGSVVSGDIATARLVVQEGGEVNGHVRMGEPGKLPAPKPTAAEGSQKVPETVGG